MHSDPADGRNPSFGMTEAAKGIPRSILSELQLHKMSNDSRRYLTHDEEAQLANFILQLAEIGYGKSCSQVHLFYIRTALN